MLTVLKDYMNPRRNLSQRTKIVSREKYLNQILNRPRLPGFCIPPITVELFLNLTLISFDMIILALLAAKSKKTLFSRYDVGITRKDIGLEDNKHFSCITIILGLD